MSRFADKYRIIASAAGWIERADRGRLRFARQAVQEAERAVMEAEARVAELHETLEDPALYTTADGSRRAAALGAELDAARLTLDAAFQRWAAASEALEQLEG